MFKVYFSGDTHFLSTETTEKNYPINCLPAKIFNLRSLSQMTDRQIKGD